MTAPINTINDGDVVFGSRQLTIGAQAFETDDFNLDPATVRFLRTNGKGIATGRVTLKTELTGTASLMYSSSSVTMPKFGDSFTTTYEGASITCTISKDPVKETKGAETKIPITFDVNISTVVTSTN